MFTKNYALAPLLFFCSTAFAASNLTLNDLKRSITSLNTRVFSKDPIFKEVVPDEERNLWEGLFEQIKAFVSDKHKKLLPELEELHLKSLTLMSMINSTAVAYKSNVLTKSDIDSLEEAKDSFGKLIDRINESGSSMFKSTRGARAVCEYFALYLQADYQKLINDIKRKLGIPLKK